LIEKEKPADMAIKQIDQSTSLDQANSVNIDCRLLLSLYFIIPVALVVVALDQLFLGQAMLTGMFSMDPSRWAFWTLIFNLPHIVASWVTFADKAYIRHYRSEFTVALPIVVLLTIVLHVFIGGAVAFLVSAIYTMYHVLSQQFGITIMMLGIKPNNVYRWWRWLSIIGTLFIYLVIYGGSDVETANVLDVLAPQLSIAAASLFLGASVFFAYQLDKQSELKLGKYYLWSNVAMVFSCLIVARLGYIAFVIMIPRILHDITAFIVYITHDDNRNRKKTVNYVYKLTSFSKLPYWLLCPATAILMAYALTTVHNIYVSTFIFAITYFHYYFEGFIWKGSSLHRQQAHFSRGG
jgi:hypothetical protein